MIASVPSQGNEQMAAGILQVTSSQLEAILGESELYAEAGAGPLHPMMEGRSTVDLPNTLSSRASYIWLCMYGHGHNETKIAIVQSR